MIYSEQLLEKIEDVRIRLTNDILESNGGEFEILNRQVEFMNDFYTDENGWIWYEFNYSGHGHPFHIWARMNSEREFVSIVDTDDAQYYTR